MDGFKLFDSITIKNFLSFGPENEPFKMEPLNVLIGPNGSGKSNFIEAFKFLRSLPKDFSSWYASSGGSELLYKRESKSAHICISAILQNKTFSVSNKFREKLSGKKCFFSYEIDLLITNKNYSIYKESLKDTESKNIYFSLSKSIIEIFSFNDGIPDARKINAAVLDDEIPTFVRLRDPERYPELASLFKSLNSDMKIYDNISYRPEYFFRNPLSIDLNTDFLNEDTQNVAMVLNELETNYPAVYKKIEQCLTKFFPYVERVSLKFSDGNVRFVFFEKGLETQIPALRYSDGTLRFIALLVILCHPTPPPFICIEEPETGLHPDAISILGDLLKDASQRTQIVVTTHSPDLVAEFTDRPEAVVVMDRDENGASTMNRLDGDRLKSWLENDYSLGNIWQSGEIGGNLY